MMRLKVMNNVLEKQTTYFGLECKSAFLMPTFP